MKDKLRVALMVVLVLALLAMAGGFWTFVAAQAEKEKAQEETDRAEEFENETGGIEVMYVALGTKGEDYIFVDNGGGLVTFDIPEGILYNRDGKEISREQLYTGDKLKLYGDILVAESYPGQYSGVEKVVLVSKGKAEDAREYAYEIQEYCGQPINARERTGESLMDAAEQETPEE